MNALERVIHRYSGQAGGAAAAPENPQADFEQVTQAAPREVVAEGISYALHSDQTLPFPEIVADLFSRSDPHQRAGLLNRLVNSAGPGMVAALPGFGGGEITSDQASQISPVQVQELAAQSERQNPSIVDQVGGFYAQHPDLMKALGGAALTMAMRYMFKSR